MGLIAQRPSSLMGLIAQRLSSLMGLIAQRLSSLMGLIAQRLSSFMGLIAQRPSSRGPRDAKRGSLSCMSCLSCMNSQRSSRVAAPVAQKYPNLMLPRGAKAAHAPPPLMLHTAEISVSRCSWILTARRRGMSLPPSDTL